MIPENATSHLLLVRLWSEEIDVEEAQWRGKVKHVTSGDVRYFVDLPDLVECIQSFLPVKKDIGGKIVSTQISTAGIHHFTLTVTEVSRSIEFYSSLLGFQMAVDLGERKILSNGSTLLVLGPPPVAEEAIANDSFNENRVGLDHVSFSVESRDQLQEAAELFDSRGVSRGEIKDLGPDLGIYVLAFRDPDNIQLELTAPYS